MEYLYNERKPSTAAHIWTGFDTACRLYSTNGAMTGSRWKLHETPGDRRVCNMCQHSHRKTEANPIKTVENVPLVEYGHLPLAEINKAVKSPQNAFARQLRDLSRMAENGSLTFLSGVYEVNGKKTLLNYDARRVVKEPPPFPSGPREGKLPWDA